MQKKFVALVIRAVKLQKTLKIELYVKIGLNAFETCDGMRTVAKIAAYFVTSLSAVYRQTDGLEAPSCLSNAMHCIGQIVCM